ncbi:MAG: hypothetical protein GY826_13960 [Fuerstiella sp.]|nr:hypothetical protein [Fuerstiella sp.]
MSEPDRHRSTTTPTIMTAWHLPESGTAPEPHNSAITATMTLDCCFVFEYARGGELFSVLRDRNRLQENDARFYATEIVVMMVAWHLLIGNDVL